MARINQPGLSAARWLLFLTFIHTIPSLFVLVVIAGFAPAAGLLVAGIVSVFLGDAESLWMGAFLLGPALIYLVIYYCLAWLLSKLLFRIGNKIARTVVLALLAIALLLSTLAPIYAFGGHGPTSSVNLVQLLQDYRLAPAVLVSYAATLLLVLSLLAVGQHMPERISGLRDRYVPWLVLPRYFVPGLLAGAALVTVMLAVYHNRARLICEPYARAGNVRAQLCMARAARARSDLDAVGWYERAAEQGSRTAVRELLQILRDRDKRAKWLRVAAEDGDPAAQFELFELLRRGEQSPQRTREALHWLTAAAKSDHPQAQFELGRHYDTRGPAHDPALARDWWERAAELDNGAAMMELAWRYEAGLEGFPLDLERAAELCDAIADGIDTGLYEFKGHDAAGFRARSAELGALQRDARDGDMDAQAELGNRILGSRNPGPDGRQQAIAWLEKAADQGDAQTQYELGRMFIRGLNDVPKDLPRGRKWWDRAAAQNHLRTLEYVADGHLSGKYGYPVDLLKARPALVVLVSAYRDGARGIEPDRKKAAYWISALKDVDRRIASLGGHYVPMDQLRARAEAGDAEAQYRLGVQLLESYSRDAHAQAVEWWIRAADLGHHEAQYRLVSYYNRGDRFVEKDHRRVVELLEQATAGKHPRAMLALALAYEKGRYGLPRDLGSARDLYAEIVAAGENDLYGWDMEERFYDMPRRRLEYLARLR